MTLPKPYLSYSALELWRSNKEQFRDKYYRNIKSPSSPEMEFGHKIAKQLETKITNPTLQSFVDSGKLPLYPEREYRIQVTVEGVPFLGYLDMYNMDTHAFRDQKTSHKTPRGEHAWTQKRVDSHSQLPFYSMLIEKNHGFVHDACHIDYMETDWRGATWTIGKAILKTRGELFLTGHIESFERTVTSIDRYQELEKAVQAAHEIEKDYQNYLKNV